MTATTARLRAQYEGRAAQLELVDLDVTNSGYLAATAVPYNVKADIGYFTESFKPGSLAKSITEAARGLPLHLFHDDGAGADMTYESWPIGVATEWQDDDTRLRGVWKFDSSVKAQRARELATPDPETGVSMLGYMSIRFAPIRSEWQMLDLKDWNPDLGPDHKDHVDRIEARLVSVGLVSTPAYIGATVDFVRSAPPPNREVGTRELDAWRSWAQEIRSR
jgi:phage head maturation protease